MQSSRFSGLVLLIAFLTSCGHQSPNDAVTKELKTVTSWTATAHWVADAWTHQSVPTVYATQTLQKSQEELQQEMGSLTRLGGVKQYSSLPGQIRQIQRSVHQLSEGISQDDRAIVDQQIQQLSQQEQNLHASVDRLKEPS